MFWGSIWGPFGVIWGPKSRDLVSFHDKIGVFGVNDPNTVKWPIWVISGFWHFWGFPGLGGPGRQENYWLFGVPQTPLLALLAKMAHLTLLEGGQVVGGHPKTRVLGVKMTPKRVI